LEYGIKFKIPDTTVYFICYLYRFHFFIQYSILNALANPLDFSSVLSEISVPS